MVQIEIRRRKEIGSAYSGISPFSSKLICSSCGGFYGPKVWNSTDKYRKTVWQCNNKFKGKKVHRCLTPIVSEDAIKEAFINAYNTYVVNKERIIEDLNEGLKIAFNTGSLDKKIQEVKYEIEGITLLVERLIEENSTLSLSQVEYKEKYESLEQTYNKKKLILDELEMQKRQILEREIKMKMYILNLEKAPKTISNYDQTLWNLFVESAVVLEDGKIKIKFNRI